MIKDAKVTRTADGEIRLTLSERQAQLLVELLGPTHGDLGFSIYNPLADVVPSRGWGLIEDELDDLHINTDSIPETKEKH